MARELLKARQDRSLGRIATRVNRVQAGLRSVLLKSARKLRGPPRPDSWREAMIAIDPQWGQAQTWHAIRRTGERFTLRHYLHALDLDQAPAGGIIRQPPDLRIYLPLLRRTLAVSLGITLLCLLLGYPIAYLIANAPPRRANLLLLLVLVPFWTSLLVRTTSWIVLLQTQGVINDLLAAVGLIAEDQRISLIYNMTGTVVAMTHVLLPFMVLPLYSVMRTIPPLYMRAAASLGASFAQAFRRVYWPQTLPGVAAGSLLVFILSIGYYITPRSGGRTERPTHLQHGCLPHATVSQLGTGCRAGWHPAGGRVPSLSCFRPSGRGRPHEIGVRRGCPTKRGGGRADSATWPSARRCSFF